MRAVKYWNRFPSVMWNLHLEDMLNLTAQVSE